MKIEVLNYNLKTWKFTQIMNPFTTSLELVQFEWYWEQFEFYLMRSNYTHVKLRYENCKQ